MLQKAHNQRIIDIFMNDIRLDFENIRGVEVDQNLLQRILGVGDVLVGSSMHADVEMTMAGVRHPEKYREIIEKRIHSYFKRTASESINPREKSHYGHCH